MEIAVERGVDAKAAGVLVDEQFGGDVPKLAHEHGLSLTMPVEKSGQNEFDFQYGSDFGAHIEKFDPFASKVLVRYNPDGDAEMNERQLGRLKELADWLHDNDRLFLFELLVPAEDAQLESVGGDTDRYDAELRPELMRRAIENCQNFGIEVDIWKIEGVDAREDAEMLSEQARKGEGRENVKSVLLGRGASDDKVDHWLRQAARRRGLRRLRDRPLDLVGRAEGLPRRQPGPHARRPSRSPTTTCASSRSTTRRRRARYRRHKPCGCGRALRISKRPSSRRSRRIASGVIAFGVTPSSALATAMPPARTATARCASRSCCSC